MGDTIQEAEQEGDQVVLISPHLYQEGEYLGKGVEEEEAVGAQVEGRVICAELQSAWEAAGNC